MWTLIRRRIECFSQALKVNLTQGRVPAARSISRQAPNGGAPRRKAVTMGKPEEQRRGTNGEVRNHMSNMEGGAGARVEVSI